MTRCESYPLCSGTIYFPTAPFFSCDRLFFLFPSLCCLLVTYLFAYLAIFKASHRVSNYFLIF